ncbi:hypothetical protein [Nocardioides sp.]|uniref:hypothetical protein n=1 Tax=Nocardioides sp. TaxID=35761 RepID=UPI00271BD2BD|nr:hypothetical protein [Nocardioides sp.]MDO9455372.1 hypothetical protein [Nocardioides sp.]
MRDLVGGPAVIGRLRAALLLAVAVLAVADLTTYVALVAQDDRTTADDVARQVVQAVADDDCGDLGDLLADDAVLPTPVTACLQGRTNAVRMTDVAVLDTSTDGDGAEVRIALESGGRPTEIVVDLQRDDDRWLVTAIRAPD